MKVHAIRTGSVKVKTAQLAARGGDIASKINIFRDPNWSDWLPTYAWAIEHPEGVIVVDTGQATYLLDHGRSPHPFLRWEADFQMEPEDEVGPQLKALGIGPRDVRQVVVTHLHVDHDAGLRHFPDSKILAAGGEIDKASAFMGMVRGYLPQRWPSWFDPARLQLADGAYGPFAASQRLTVAGDVVVVATPGHTPDHVSVIVEDGNESIFLAGDTSYTEALMVAGKVDGVSPDAKVTASTLAKIRQFATERPTIYLPGHDPDSGSRLAKRQTVYPVQSNIVELRGAA